MELKKQKGNFEVVVIDDASIDNTKEVVINCAENLTYNLVYIKLKYQVGLPCARNVGLNQSNYNIIGYLDDDCLPIYRDLLKRAYSWLTQGNKSIIGVGGPVYSKPNKTSLNNNRFKLSKIFEFLEFLYYKRLKLTYVSSVSGGNCFFKKEFVEMCDGFDPNFDGNYYREETDLCIRIRKYGKLVSDPKMSVNHLQINYGGCRKDYSKFYSNIFENTIFLLLKNKKLTIEVVFDTIKHFLGFMYNFTTGSLEKLMKKNRLNLLISIIQGICKGFEKALRKKKIYSYIIDEKLEFYKPEIKR